MLERKDKIEREEIEKRFKEFIDSPGQNDQNRQLIGNFIMRTLEISEPLRNLVNTVVEICNLTLVYIRYSKCQKTFGESTNLDENLKRLRDKIEKIEEEFNGIVKSNIKNNSPDFKVQDEIKKEHDRYYKTWNTIWDPWDTLRSKIVIDPNEVMNLKLSTLEELNKISHLFEDTVSVDHGRLNDDEKTDILIKITWKKILDDLLMLIHYSLTPSMEKIEEEIKTIISQDNVKACFAQFKAEAGSLLRFKKEIKSEYMRQLLQGEVHK